MNTVSRDLIVETARDMIGTPWRHQCRLPGIALDCVGLVICTARQLGLVSQTFDIRDYTRVPDGYSLIEHCDAHLTNKTTDVALLKEGMVIVIETSKDPQHVGIIGRHHSGELSIIHATNGLLRKEVCEQRLVFGKRFAFVCAYDFVRVDG